MSYYIGIKGVRHPSKTLNAARVKAMRLIMEGRSGVAITKSKTGKALWGTVMLNKDRFEWMTPSFNFYVINKDGSLGGKV